MANYNYKALSTTGAEVKGSMEASNKEEVIAYIKNERMVPIEVLDVGALGAEINIKAFDRKPKARDMAVFSRQFVSITSAGVSINNALEMLAEQTENKMLAAAIDDCRISIQSGNTLAASMGQHPKVFPEIFVTMVAAGEISGNLETSFERMGEQFEKDAKITGAIKKAMIYPIVICIVAIIVMAIMLIYVVPQFETMFADLGSKLPMITQSVVDASDFMVERWYILLAIVIILVVGIKYFLSTEVGNHVYAKLQLKVPLVSNLVEKSTSARFCRTLSTLIASGIGITEALEIVEDVVINTVFKDVVGRARTDVSLGVPLSQPLRDGKVFPPMVCHMVKIGEEVGDLESMLTKTAEYYEEEVETAVQSLMAALEPLIIVVLACVVGYIVLALILPMTQMINDLGNL